MGNYADAADVQALIPEFTIGPLSRPSTTEVEAMITGLEAHLNGILIKLGYTAPAVGETDVLLLGNIVSKKAAADVLWAAFGADRAGDKAQRWHEEWLGFLRDLRTGASALIDQDPVGADEPAFGVTRTVTRDPIFTNRYGTTDWDE